MRRRGAGALALAPAVGTLGVLFGAALVGAVAQSLEPGIGGGPSSWTLEAWRSVLRDPAFVDSLRFSAQITLAATLGSAALAVAVAGALRHRGPALRAVFSLPVPVPHLIVAVLAVLWLAPGGLADRALGALPVDLVRDQAGLGVVLVYLYKETPFLVLLLLAAMGRELHAREEAAAVLGASRAQRLRWVLWPAIRGPLVVGSLIVAAFVFGAFEVPLTVGPNYPPTLATYAFEATQGDLLAGQGRAAAGGGGAAAASLAMALVAVRVARGGPHE